MLQVNFLSRLDEQGEGSLGGEIEKTCAHSFGLAASAFKLCVSMLKPECYRKCLHIRLSVFACVRVCVCVSALHHRIPIASDTAKAFRLPHCTSQQTTHHQ